MTQLQYLTIFIRCYTEFRCENEIQFNAIILAKHEQAGRIASASLVK